MFSCINILKNEVSSTESLFCMPLAICVLNYSLTDLVCSAIGLETVRELIFALCAGLSPWYCAEVISPLRISSGYRRPLSYIKCILSDANRVRKLIFHFHGG